MNRWIILNYIRESFEKKYFHWCNFTVVEWSFLHDNLKLTKAYLIVTILSFISPTEFHKFKKIPFISISLITSSKSDSISLLADRFAKSAAEATARENESNNFFHPLMKVYGREISDKNSRYDFISMECRALSRQWIAFWAFRDAPEISIDSTSWKSLGVLRIDSWVKSAFQRLIGRKITSVSKGL